MEMGSSPDSSLSSLVICVDFLGNATKPATGDDKDATLVMLEASQRIVQDLCKSNEFQSQQIQLTHLGRRHVDEEHAVEGSINLQHNISDDRTNAASAFQQQRWAFFSIRPSRTSASTVVSTKQATHVYSFPFDRVARLRVPLSAQNKRHTFATKFWNVCKGTSRTLYSSTV